VTSEVCICKSWASTKKVYVPANTKRSHFRGILSFPAWIFVQHHLPYPSPSLVPSLQETLISAFFPFRTSISLLTTAESWVRAPGAKWKRLWKPWHPSAFLNGDYRKQITTPAEVETSFVCIHPRSGTTVGSRLHSILGPYLEQRGRDAFKPLDIIVIGDSNPGDDVKSVIVSVARESDELETLARQVRIQLCQVGSPEARNCTRNWRLRWCIKAKETRNLGISLLQFHGWKHLMEKQYWRMLFEQ